MKYSAKFRRSQLVLAKPILERCSLSFSRSGQDTLGKMMTNPYLPFVDVEDFEVNGVPCSLIHPKDEVSGAVVLYLHGGGYTCGTLPYAKGFSALLSARLGMKVMTVAYRLAPENPYPAALDDAMEAYGYLLSHGYDPSQIVLCGESAGGGLAYALSLKLKAKARTLPAGIIAISPWVDLTNSAPSYRANAKRDPSLTQEKLDFFANCYLWGEDPEKPLTPKINANREDDLANKKNPLVSPLYGDLSKMPPSLIFVGGDELLLDDAKNLHHALTHAHSKSELVVAPGMWHAYILYGIKEREKDFEKIYKFIHHHVPETKKLRWMSLDNAAKIFPAARRRNWANIFRLSATLYEDVDYEVLKSALDVTVRRFPSIAVRVRTGAFWYYLEEIPKAPDIAEEKPYPLSRIPFDDIRKCAFRVIHWEKRIAVEFFHALTDGNGGLVFLSTLVAEYLYQKHGVKVPTGTNILDRLEEPTPGELEDSFLTHAGKTPASRSDTDAFRIMGKREEDGFKTNTTFIMDAATVVKEAKKRGVTVTAYLVSALIMATNRIQNARVKNPKKRKYIKVHVPVNLRKIFPSKTLRNFILYAVPGIDPRLGDYTFDEICGIVHHQMKLQITEKNMASLIATNVKDEKNKFLKVTPLFLKNIVMKMVFDAVGERKSCFSFSNLGVADLPDEFTRYVKRMDFVIGVQASAPYNTSAITYGGNLYLNIIRNMEDPVLENALYGVLKELGIPHKVESNIRYRS